MVDFTNGAPFTPNASLFINSYDTHTTLSADLPPPPLSSPKSLSTQQQLLSSESLLKDDDNFPIRLSSLQAQPNGPNGIYSQTMTQPQWQQQQHKDHTFLSSQDMHPGISLEPSPTLSATNTSVASVGTFISSPASSVSFTTQSNTLYTSPAPAPSKPPSDMLAETRTTHTSSLHPRRSSYAPTNVEDLESTVVTVATSETYHIPTASPSSTPIASSQIQEDSFEDLQQESINVATSISNLQPQPASIKLGQNQQRQLKVDLAPADLIVAVSSAELSPTSAGSNSPKSAPEPRTPPFTPPHHFSTHEVRRLRPESQVLDDSAISLSRQTQFSPGESSSRARRRQIYRRNTYSADLGTTSFHRSDDETELDELEEARKRMEVLKKSSSRRMSKRKKDDDNDRVLIGTRIGEDHAFE
ncbi:hypothetical protein BGZ76_002471 [Entomortierella beljakovae]|nr:hypothetical protein BGZ76_002471 [Entomortierella beljakovae]